MAVLLDYLTDCSLEYLNHVCVVIVVVFRFFGGGGEGVTSPAP